MHLTPQVNITENYIKASRVIKFSSGSLFLFETTRKHASDYLIANYYGPSFPHHTSEADHKQTPRWRYRHSHACNYDAPVIYRSNKTTACAKHAGYLKPAHADLEQSQEPCVCMCFNTAVVQHTYKQTYYLCHILTYSVSTIENYCCNVEVMSVKGNNEIDLGFRWLTSIILKKK